MIQFTGIDKGKSGNVVFDDYIPFSFKAYDGVLPGPRMWRTGDLSTNLLEAKIEPDNNRLVGVTLVSYNGEVVGKSIYPWMLMPMEVGLPIVDVSVFPATDFPSNRFDDPIALVVALYDSVLEIGFGNSASPCRRIVSGRLHFLINIEDLFCGLAISGITADEKARIAGIL